MAGKSTTVPKSLTSRLGYLLKHAQLRLTEALGAALAPHGIDGREVAVLVLLADEYPLSQQEAGARLGVDRTTMVALLDTLEGKGLVERRRSPDDRRKNIVGLTSEGKDLVRRAELIRAGVEAEFLAPLSEREARGLVAALRKLVAAAPPGNTVSDPHEE
jgi:DNA-binding MarR family transcriptional regulator